MSVGGKTKPKLMQPLPKNFGQGVILRAILVEQANVELDFNLSL